jgi:hypothetical protein
MFKITAFLRLSAIIPASSLNQGRFYPPLQRLKPDAHADGGAAQKTMFRRDSIEHTAQLLPRVNIR